MQKLFFLLLSFISVYSGKIPDNREQVIVNRMAYIYNLKSWVDKEAWKGFADPAFDLPLVYYADSNCYIANPTSKFIADYQPKLVFQDKALKIYKTVLLDSLPFHMETSMTFGDTSSLYNFRSPFMNCSSVEITKNTVPGTSTTEQWATLVLHEYFHGFQFKHNAHLSYFEKKIVMIPDDSLRRIYKSQPWFKESIDKENNFLLAALNTTDRRQTISLVDSFFHYRSQRRTQTKQRLNFDIRPIEECFETMEGTARYAEYSLYTKFMKKKPISGLRNDSLYQSYQYFRNYTINKDEWLYLTNKTTYFYAIGFNMARLMDKLRIEYKSRLFNEGGLSLEQLLTDHLSKKSSR